MFERTLESLIRGLRSHRGADEAAFVATLLEEIRHELRSGDMDVKAGALLKLTYLRMLGYPSSHASFPTLEVMASNHYHLKQVGYLAATHSFTHDTDVIILVTNLIKKDLHSANPLEVALALNGLSHIATPDLAQHVAPDIVGMMNHSRASIRKKAILAYYAIVQQYPEALDQGWHRLREKLQDDDAGVVSTTVNIVCELARKNPRPFLPLAPQLFDLLNASSNNWMLIKIVKLFGYLAPCEPRLVRRLLPPIKSLISTTPAMSLLYESIHSVISGEMLDGPGGDDLARECVDRLAAFLDDEDRNLRYIALLALVRILPTHPHLVADFQAAIFRSVDDDDLSIRLRALDLVSGMASRRNSQEIIDALMAHLDARASKTTTAASALKRSLQQTPSSSALLPSRASLRSYRLEIAHRILAIGQRARYANIDDFDPYIGVLVRLAGIDGAVDGDDGGVSVAAKVREQLVQITARVEGVRRVAVAEMVRVIAAEGAATEGEAAAGEAATAEAAFASSTAAVASSSSFTSPSPPPPLLSSAAYIVGEYAEHVSSPRITIPQLLAVASSSSSSLDSTMRASCIHNGVKLFAHWAAVMARQWEVGGGGGGDIGGGGGGGGGGDGGIGGGGIGGGGGGVGGGRIGGGIGGGGIGGGGIGGVGGDDDGGYSENAPVDASLSSSSSSPPPSLSSLAEVLNVAKQVQAHLRRIADDDDVDVDVEVLQRVREFQGLFRLLVRDLEAWERGGKAGAAAKQAGVEVAAAANKDKSADSTAAGGGGGDRDAASTSMPAPASASTSTTALTSASTSTPTTATTTWGDAAQSSSSSPRRPRCPVSLHLLAPLFTPHPLGPVGSSSSSKPTKARAGPPGFDINVPLVVGTGRKIALPGVGGGGGGVDKKVKGGKDKGKAKGGVVGDNKGGSAGGKGKGKDVGGEGEGAGMAAQRQRRHDGDPFYLGSSSSSAQRKVSSSSPAVRDDDDDDDLADVPIVQLSLEDMPKGFPSKGKKRGEADQEKKAETTLIGGDGTRKDPKGKERGAVGSAPKKKKAARAVASVMD